MPEITQDETGPQDEAPKKKGVRLTPGQIAVLSLDGTMVYVEAVESQWTAVVALPEQPPGRTDDRVFTPGKVGSKKVSAFAEYDSLIEVADLSQRNREFIGTYELLRQQHGPHFVDRTPEEEAAYQQASLPKSKRQKKEKKLRGARYLSICAQCGEQPGHPNHPNDHAFVAKVDDAPKVRRTREPREKKVRERGPGRPTEGSRMIANPNLRHKWIGTDEQLNVLTSVNAKFKAKNSGGFIVDYFLTHLDTGASVNEVTVHLATTKWSDVAYERIHWVFVQLIAAKLIEPTTDEVIVAVPVRAGDSTTLTGANPTQVIVDDPMLESLHEAFAAIRDADKTLPDGTSNSIQACLSEAIAECKDVAAAILAEQEPPEPEPEPESEPEPEPEPEPERGSPIDSYREAVAAMKDALKITGETAGMIRVRDAFVEVQSALTE